MKIQRPFLVVLSLVLFVSLACKTVLGSTEEEAPTEVVVIEEDEPTDEPEEVQVTEAAETEEPATDESYFTEEFESDPKWDLIVVPDHPDPTKQSDPESVTINFSDSRMIFNIPEVWLSAFYTYTGETYENVRVDIEYQNRGVNSQQVSLVCRSDGEDESYELEVSNDGTWVFKVNRRPMSNGASTAIKTGKSTNHHTLLCVDNEISFFFNGVEPKGSPYIDNQAVLGEGYAGFVVTAKKAIPVDVEIDWFQISEP
jgi:hypothetical protein